MHYLCEARNWFGVAIFFNVTKFPDVSGMVYNSLYLLNDKLSRVASLYVCQAVLIYGPRDLSDRFRRGFLSRASFIRIFYILFNPLAARSWTLFFIPQYQAVDRLFGSLIKKNSSATVFKDKLTQYKT